MRTSSGARKHPGGRPRKFQEPSQPITVTLPDRTLAQLDKLGKDRARAIAWAVDIVAGHSKKESAAVDVVRVAPGIGLLLVPPNHSLRRIPWLRMVEVSPTRHLLAITPGTPIERVEVALSDLIEESRKSGSNDTSLLESLREKIGQLRRGNKFSTAEILFVTTGP